MALVLTSLVDLLHVHADLKIDRIHLNARDEFLLSRAFSFRTSLEFLDLRFCWFRVLTSPSAGYRRHSI